MGQRVREVRGWRGLTLRGAAGLAGLSYFFWGQVERGEKPVATRRTLESTARTVRPQLLPRHPAPGPILG
jgi:hypothetical protein